MADAITQAVEDFGKSLKVAGEQTSEDIKGMWDNLVNSTDKWAGLYADIAMPKEIQDAIAFVTTTFDNINGLFGGFLDLVSTTLDIIEPILQLYDLVSNPIKQILLETRTLVNNLIDAIGNTGVFAMCILPVEKDKVKSDILYNSQELVRRRVDKNGNFELSKRALEIEKRLIEITKKGHTPGGISPEEFREKDNLQKERDRMKENATYYMMETVEVNYPKRDYGTEHIINTFKSAFRENPPTSSLRYYYLPHFTSDMQVGGLGLMMGLPSLVEFQRLFKDILKLFNINPNFSDIKTLKTISSPKINISGSALFKEGYIEVNNCPMKTSDLFPEIKEIEKIKKAYTEIKNKIAKAPKKSGAESAGEFAGQIERESVPDNSNLELTAKALKLEYDNAIEREKELNEFKWVRLDIRRTDTETKHCSVRYIIFQKLGLPFPRIIDKGGVIELNFYDNDSSFVYTIIDTKDKYTYNIRKIMKPVSEAERAELNLAQSVTEIEVIEYIKIDSSKKPQFLGDNQELSLIRITPYEGGIVVGDNDNVVSKHGAVTNKNDLIIKQDDKGRNVLTLEAQKLEAEFNELRFINEYEAHIREMQIADLKKKRKYYEYYNARWSKIVLPIGGTFEMTENLFINTKDTYLEDMTQFYPITEYKHMEYWYRLGTKYDTLTFSVPYKYEATLSVCTENAIPYVDRPKSLEETSDIITSPIDKNKEEYMKLLNPGDLGTLITLDSATKTLFMPSNIIETNLDNIREGLGLPEKNLKLTDFLNKWIGFSVYSILPFLKDIKELINQGFDFLFNLIDTSDSIIEEVIAIIINTKNEIQTILSEIKNSFAIMVDSLNVVIRGPIYAKLMQLAPGGNEAYIDYMLKGMPEFNSDTYTGALFFLFGAASDKTIENAEAIIKVIADLFNIDLVKGIENHVTQSWSSYVDNISQQAGNVAENYDKLVSYEYGTNVDRSQVDENPYYQQPQKFE